MTRTQALARLDIPFTRVCILRAFGKGCTIVELAQLTDVSCADIEAVLREALRSQKGTT